MHKSESCKNISLHHDAQALKRLASARQHPRQGSLNRSRAPAATNDKRAEVPPIHAVSVMYHAAHDINFSASRHILAQAHHTQESTYFLSPTLKSLANGVSHAHAKITFRCLLEVRAALHPHHSWLSIFTLQATCLTVMAVFCTIMVLGLHSSVGQLKQTTWAHVLDRIQPKPHLQVHDAVVYLSSVHECVGHADTCIWAAEGAQGWSGQ